MPCVAAAARTADGASCCDAHAACGAAAPSPTDSSLGRLNRPIAASHAPLRATNEAVAATTAKLRGACRRSTSLRKAARTSSARLRLYSTRRGSRRSKGGDTHTGLSSVLCDVVSAPPAAPPSSSSGCAKGSEGGLGLLALDSSSVFASSSGSGVGWARLRSVRARLRSVPLAGVFVAHLLSSRPAAAPPEPSRGGDNQQQAGGMLVPRMTGSIGGAEGGGARRWRRRRR